MDQSRRQTGKFSRDRQSWWALPPWCRREKGLRYCARLVSPGEEGDDAGAEADLGAAYLFGCGFPVDDVQSLRWLLIAANHPENNLSPKNASNIANMEARLMPSEIAQAKKLALQWVPPKGDR